MRLAWLVLLVGCSSKVEAVCDAAAQPWAPEKPVFREVTDEWGLSEIQATGVRMAAVDVDHDGWTDLVIRKGAGADDFGAEGVRQVWYLRNTGQGRFEDVTQASGLVATRSGDNPNIGRMGSAYVFGDVDNDGDLDVYSGNPDSAGTSPDTSEILLNDGTGKFTLADDDSELRRGEGDMPFGPAFVDFDRDGKLDLYTAQYDNADGPQQSRLYRGKGDGTFEDVTDEVGLETKAWGSIAVLDAGQSHTRSWAGLACDLNNDGASELMASSYGRSPNHLWLNDGSGEFDNQSVLSGYAYDDRKDWSDNQSARCWCMLHPTDTDCAGVPEPDLIACDSDEDAFRWDHDFDRYSFRLGGNSGATQCADLDNDGWFDLVTSEIVHWDVGSSSDPSEILRNTQDPTVVFERPGNEVTGLTRDHDIVAWNDGDITGSVFDFDNDGWNDIYIGSSDYPSTRGLLYHQSSPLQFQPVPFDEGIDHMRSHGSVVADFDRDGDLDFVVGHSSARCDSDCYETFSVRMFENQLGGNFVQVEVVGGAGSNRSAIGARVEAKAGGITQTHQVDGGHGQFGAQDDLVQHFGLGSACEAEITVTWPTPDRPQQTFTVAAGHRWRIVQGAEEPELIDPPKAE
jgi:hypothetical protein